jgi:hypothetical protein
VRSLTTAALAFFLFVLPVAAQQQPVAAGDPLLQLKEEVQRVLAEEKIPFTDDKKRPSS